MQCKLEKNIQAANNVEAKRISNTKKIEADFKFGTEHFVIESFYFELDFLCIKGKVETNSKELETITFTLLLLCMAVAIN